MINNIAKCIYDDIAYQVIHKSEDALHFYLLECIEKINKSVNKYILDTQDNFILWRIESWGTYKNKSQDCVKIFLSFDFALKKEREYLKVILVEGEHFVYSKPCRWDFLKKG